VNATPPPDSALLEGTYAPSSEQWVREHVELYERSGGLEGATQAGTGRRYVLVTSLGARSGLVRKTPLIRVEWNGAYAAVASQGGAATHPSWYFNLLAHPRVLVQDGPARFDLTARVLEGQERSQWWSRACVAFPSYADYQSATERTIPVFLLERPDR
jgi:deazaflavin-dependent oxidoreductase (nitroreductase family)